MSKSQLTLFKMGCYFAFITAALHMFGHLSGPQLPTNDTERQLLDLMTNYKYAMPAGPGRSPMDFMNGFSLLFSLMTALTGGLGLIIARRAGDDVLLMLGTSRALAGAYVVSLAISLTYFFIVPTICLAAIATCFAIASVRFARAAS